MRASVGPCRAPRPVTRIGHLPALPGAGLAAAGLLGAGGCAQDGALAPAGEAAANIAQLWWFMLATAIAVFVVVLVLLVIGVVRSEAPSGDKRDRGDQRFIVAGGLVLPGVVLLALLVFNLDTVADQPEGGDTVDVQVVGKRWWWEVRYPQRGIVSANEVHIPTDEQVRIHLTGEDVIHSFWVPQLAGKRDVIPGRENVLTLSADQPGVYRGRCAEFCGVQHANMDVFVIAHPPEEFEAWAEDAAESAPEPQTADQRQGRATFMDVGCASCHTIRGTPADGQLGPDLTHFASRRTIGAGAAPNDRGHLAGWVTNAQNIKPGNLMPPQQIPADELSDLLDYLESLQ